MQYFFRRFSSLLILAWIALLLMGADGQVKSSGTVSIISSVSSSLTNQPSQQCDGQHNEQNNEQCVQQRDQEHCTRRCEQADSH